MNNEIKKGLEDFAKGIKINGNPFKASGAEKQKAFDWVRGWLRANAQKNKEA